MEWKQKPGGVSAGEEAECTAPTQASAIRCAIPALVLSALVLLPNLGKAFTVDDTVFLFEARHALQDPLHPTAFEMTWAHYPERVSRIVPTGPVIGWLLMPCILAGGQEWVAHATLLVALWIGIVATVSVARRLGLPPRWMTASGLLLAASPGVLAMAGTAMPDVAAMAVGVAALERLVAWDQDRRPHQALAAAVLLGLAPLARPHLALEFGVAALLLFAGRTISTSRIDGAIRLLPWLAAAAVTTSLLLVTRDPAPGAGTPVGAAAMFSSLALGRIAVNATAFPIHWVLTTTFALPWIVLRWRPMKGSALVWFGAIGGTVVGAGALVMKGHAPWLLAPIAGLGTAALVDAQRDAWQARGGYDRALACWLLLGLAAIPYVHLPAKFLVASAPAAALLVAQAANRVNGVASRRIVGAALVAGTLLGSAIVRADAVFANVGRRAVAELIAPRVAAGEHVWFVGRWGFQWYAENAGARPVTLTPPYPVPGDVVVVSAASARSDEVLAMLSGQYPRSAVLAHLGDATPGGRITNKRLGIGFYSNVSGYWPWMWASSTIDEFVALRLWP